MPGRFSLDEGTLAAFGLAALGLYGYFWIASTLYESWSVRSWVPVKAELLYYGNDGVRYAYDFEGKRREGDRLGVGDPRTLDPEDARAAGLAEAAETQRPIRVWVDPSNPARSVIGRQAPWDALLAFGIPVVLLVGVAWRVLAGSYRVATEDDDP